MTVPGCASYFFEELLLGSYSHTFCGISPVLIFYTGLFFFPTLLEECLCSP